VAHVLLGPVRLHSRRVCGVRVCVYLSESILGSDADDGDDDDDDDVFDGLVIRIHRARSLISLVMEICRESHSHKYVSSALSLRRGGRRPLLAYLHDEQRETRQTGSLSLSLDLIGLNAVVAAQVLRRPVFARGILNESLDRCSNAGGTANCLPGAGPEWEQLGPIHVLRAALSHSIISPETTRFAAP